MRGTVLVDAVAWLADPPLLVASAAEYARGFGHTDQYAALGARLEMRARFLTVGISDLGLDLVLLELVLRVLRAGLDHRQGQRPPHRSARRRPRSLFPQRTKRAPSRTRTRSCPSA